jgi:hypothetical protein
MSKKVDEITVTTTKGRRRRKTGSVHHDAFLH